MLLRHRKPLHGLLVSNAFRPVMSSKLFIDFKSTLSSVRYPADKGVLFRCLSNSNPKLVPVSRKPSDSSFCTHASIPRPVPEEHLKKLDDEIVDTPQLKQLRLKLEKIGMACGHCMPGDTYRLLCPMCKGGKSKEKSLSLLIDEDGNGAVWNCLRAKCGWTGSSRGSADVKSSYNRMNKIAPKVKNIGKITTQALQLEPLCPDGFADVKSSYNRMNKITPKVKNIGKITTQALQLEPLCPNLLEYFAERMISGETLRRNSVMQRFYQNQIVIAFTYKRKEELISCKYRGLPKSFWQETDTEKILYGLDDIEGASDVIIETDTEKILYGLDDIEGASDVIIVEGEMDKLAMEEAGYRNCVSIPDGAPAQVSSKDLPSQEQDIRYQYLWNCKEYLEKASRIILATDGDAPGQALAEELSRRLGKERCWRVTWPSKNQNERFKDANEVLMFMGPAVLKEVIESAELYPIKGLLNFRDYFSEIDAYYHQTFGTELGISTGWKAMDDLYNVVPGELTVVTGVPNSGKSEWIYALLCNLNRSVGWKFALCSMENNVREHGRKLLEKHIKKPFFDARYGKSVERMSLEELEVGKQWLSDTFHLIRCKNDCLPSTKWVLDLAKAAVLTYGVNGLVIDPYNELDHQRPSNQTETEYVSHMLTSIKRFAQHHSCHVWFVAHPRQLQQWTGGPPNLYDISGSAHFINKCDNGIVIHRNRNPEAGALDLVQVCVRKVRNKVSGTIGDAFLQYDRVTGEYNDIK